MDILELAKRRDNILRQRRQDMVDLMIETAQAGTPVYIACISELTQSHVRKSLAREYPNIDSKFLVVGSHNDPAPKGHLRLWWEDMQFPRQLV